MTDYISNGEPFFPQGKIKEGSISNNAAVYFSGNDLISRQMIQTTEDLFKLGKRRLGQRRLQDRGDVFF